MNRTKIGLLIGVAVAFGVAGAAYADPTNLGPPPGWIDNLSGGALPLTGYQQYTTSFVATQASTNITFAFRDDPAFIHFDNAFVANSSSPATNLLLNSGFETGDLTDWTYVNQYGAAFGGQVLYNPGQGQGGSNYFWYNGAVQAYDAITQAISTTIGDTYSISFWAMEDNPVGDTNWSELSTNGIVTGTGGNGINITVYAGAIPPPTNVPEPAALGMFGFGALLIGGFLGLRRRFQ